MAEFSVMVRLLAVMLVGAELTQTKQAQVASSENLDKFGHGQGPRKYI